MTGVCRGSYIGGGGGAYELDRAQSGRDLCKRNEDGSEDVLSTA